MTIVWSEVKKKLHFDWKKDWFWIVFTIIVIFTAWAYKHDMAVCQDVMKDPCKYCGRCQAEGLFIEQPHIPNLSIENITKNG